MELQDKLEESQDRVHREAKRIQLFQAEKGLSQSVELWLKEQLAATGQLKSELESEKLELATELKRPLDKHDSYVQQMESKLNETKVSCFLFVVSCEWLFILVVPGGNGAAPVRGTAAPRRNQPTP